MLNSGSSSSMDSSSSSDSSVFPNDFDAYLSPRAGASTNAFVPWDTSYLNYYSSYIKTAIGNSVNIGVVAFAIITGILVVIAVVKKFTK